MADTKTHNDIAIVGLSCRFPGDATCPDAFLGMLRKGDSAWSTVPQNRFNIDAYYHPSYDRRGTSVTKGGHFLRQDPAHFDTSFFSISANEASAVDPQQRMLLEVAYESIESAGMTMSSIAGTEMACFVGSFRADYDQIATRDLSTKSMYAVTGTGAALCSNRLSWFYDLRGPSATVDTGCSASLVAFHLACEAIRSPNNKTRTALVGGCGLILCPDTMTSLSALHFLSPDGKSFSFDARANGYGRGEGVAMLVLKHVDDAIRDGDMIRAVIRGTAVNQDGHTSGITLPSSEAQAKLISDTYASFDLDMSETMYFEAHGTGTAAGDPLEARAIGETFGADPKRQNPLYVGSVKSNIGHLEGAAGVAGIVKSILSLESGQIFPQHDFRTANPKIDFNKWQITIPTNLTAWPQANVRRISINSFGYGGTNAHAVLDDAQSYLRDRQLSGCHNTMLSPLTSNFSSFQDSAIVTSHNIELDQNTDYFSTLQSQHPRVFSFTSSEQAALARRASDLKAYLRNKIEISSIYADQCLGDLAYTLNTGRSVFQWRAVAVASTVNELIESMEQTCKRPVKTNAVQSHLWVFTGQGAQWAQMGTSLLHYQVFANAIDSASDVLGALGANWHAKTELLADKSSSRIDQPEFSQPLCTVVQIALIKLLRHWGMRPAAVIGHSSGEIAAAYAIGALTETEALQVAYHRGRLTQSLQTLDTSRIGRMMSVGLSREDVQLYLQDLPADAIAVVACDNSPTNVTLSGDKAILDVLEQRLQTNGVFARMLKVTNAYHSPYMKEIAAVYLAALKDIEPKSCSSGCKMFSTVTGLPVDPDQLGASYWVQNMVQPVEFVAALRQALTPSSRKGRRKHAQNIAVNTILEVGPHGALQGPIKQSLKHFSMLDRISVLSILSRNRASVQDVVSVAGDLWTTGSTIDLHKVNTFDSSTKRPILLVDLPSYPWNYSTRYWSESLQHMNHRKPICGRLDYVGMPVEDFNPLEPLFKNNLLASEIPWVLDHKVQNDIIFPGAGMICAAIEASRQMANVEQELIGFELRDIQIGKALILSADTTGVQTFLSFKPRKTATKSGASAWQEWTFYTFSEQGVPTEHCSGLLDLIYASTFTEVDSGREQELQVQRQTDLYLKVSRNCTEPMSKEKHYTAMKDVGINYGPTFQGLTDILVGCWSASTQVTIPDTSAVMPSQSESESIIHPAVLDAIFQTCYPAFANKMSKEVMVPVQIDHMFVPANLPGCRGQKIKSVAQAARSGLKGLTADITGEPNETTRGLMNIEDKSRGLPNLSPLSIRGLTLAAIGSNNKSEMVDDHSVIESKICSEIVLRTDHSHMSQEQAVKILGQHRENSTALIQSLHDSAKAAAIWAQRILAVTTSESVALMAPHFQSYYTWMEEIYNIAHAKQGRYQYGHEAWLELSKHNQDSFLESFSTSNGIIGQLMASVAQHLPDMMCGKVPVLEVLMADNMLTRSYSDPTAIFTPTIFSMRDWFDLCAHKSPDMSILEVGAGTGSSTLPILNVLGGQNGTTPRFSSYTFTDISSGFFENAETLLHEWNGLIKFKKLDIEKDLEVQDFEPESFDVIAASNVLHATKNMAVTLTNCLKLLKPGGRLVLVELTASTECVSMVYGTLPGWWLSEDGRTGGPLMNEQQWDTNLRQAGFGGIDLAVSDADDPLARSMALIVATKPVIPLVTIPKIGILLQRNSQLQEQLAKELGAQIGHLVDKIQPIYLDQTLSNLDTKIPVISLCEVDFPLLKGLNSQNFGQIQHLLGTVSRILWVTSSVEMNDPNQKIVSGLFRTAMSEDSLLRTHELHFRSTVAADVGRAVELISQVFEENFCTVQDFGESETFELDGVLHIPRYIESNHINKQLRKVKSKPSARTQPLLQPGRPLKLNIASPGMLDSLEFVDHEDMFEVLRHDHVEVQIAANALNFKDIMIAMGKVPGTGIGIDCAGTVTALGSSATRLKVGDRVAFFSDGTAANFTRVHESIPQLIPDDLSFEEACTIPVIFSTAYQCVIGIGRLQPGETVLIHAASGGLGQALVQLAQYIGAEIYATVGTSAKKELLISLGVEEDHIFSSRDTSFAAGIMRMTNGQGVDVVVNSLAGEFLRKTWECVAEFGRFIEVGLVDILANTGLEMKPFLRNRTFAGVNLGDISTKMRAMLLSKVFALVKQGAIQTVQPVTVFDYSDMETAFRTMQQGRHTGKLVLKLTSDSRGPVLPRQPAALQLRSDATYVFSGLGGLARHQAIHLAAQGARNLIFLSRSGGRTTEAQNLLHELHLMEVNAEAFVCDITNIRNLRSTLSTIKDRFPPIRGVIQGAMVLSDSLLETMSYEQWRAATEPKILGTWNLHHTLPEDLDFFIMLSSAAGVMGNAGQSNYAAANTFQDEFASYRRNLGLKAQTIDLGAVKGAGYFEQNVRNVAANYVGSLKVLHIDFQDTLSMLDFAIMGSPDGVNPMPAQLVTGAGTGGLERLNRLQGNDRDLLWLSQFASFKILKQLDSSQAGSIGTALTSDEAESIQSDLSLAKTAQQASDICLERLVAKLAKAIMMDAADIDATKPLHHYGVDSLVAVEIRNWLMKFVKSDISVFELLADNSISHLASSVAVKSKYFPKALLEDSEET